MSSWVPLRTAPPQEQLCPPSTSYATTSVTVCSARLRERRCGGTSNRGRALQRIRCQASQALQSYHNAFKLLHQPSRKAEPSPPADAPSEQQQQQQQQVRASQPQAAEPMPPPPPHLPDVQAAQQRKPASGARRGSTRGADAPSASLTSRTATTTIPSPGAGSSSSNSASSSNPTTILPTRTPSSTTKHAGAMPGSSFNPEVEDLRPYVPHSVSLPAWQPPPTSLQHRTALTRAITTCPTYTRLHQLILDNAADFNCYHTCAALSRVLALHGAGLTPRESRLFKEGCSTLQSILRRQLPELQPRSLVVAAYSLARLELPDRELLAGLATAVEPHLAALQPQGLSSLLWAFARQHHQPPPKWMDALLSAAAADLGAFAPRDMATVIWALARLRYKVAPARLKQLLEHVQANMGSFCGRSLSNVVYSLALSQQHPGAEWLEAAQARAVALGPDAFTPQGITQLAWGLAKLGAAPSPAFLNLVLEHASQRLPLSPQERLREREQQQQQRGATAISPGSSNSTDGLSQQQQQQQRRGQRRNLGRYSGLDLATLMYSLASLGAQPRADLGRRLLAAVQWELPGLEPNGMCNCLWACARLRLYPARMWLSSFFDASYRQLPYFKPVDLSQTLWALARLQATPPPAWMGLVVTRLQLTASMFSPVEVASTMWALARLGVRGEALPAEVLALFFMATDRRLSSFKPQELSSMIWALAHMRRRPDKEWTAEFLKVTYHKLASMNGWCLATIAWSLAELALTPPPAWVYSFVNAARTLMNTTAAAAGGATAESEAGLSALDLGQIITALRRLNGGGSGRGGGLAKVDEFLAEAENRLAALEAESGAYAAQQLGAFLAMSPPPRQAGAGGLGLLAEAAATKPPHMVVSEPSGDIAGEAEGVSGGVDGATTAALPAEAVVRANDGARASRRRRRRQRSAVTPEQPAASLGSKDKKGGRRAGAGKLAVSAAVRARSGGGGAAAAASASEGVRQEASVATAVAAAATAAGCNCDSAVAVRPGESTRALNGGDRATLAAPPDVRVDLGGDLNIELPASQSGPVLWRPAAGAAAVSSGLATGMGGGGSEDGHGSSNGSGGGELAAAGTAAAAAGGDGAMSSLAEIKRRLLAV